MHIGATYLARIAADIYQFAYELRTGERERETETKLANFRITPARIPLSEITMLSQMYMHV